MTSVVYTELNQTQWQEELDSIQEHKISSLDDCEKERDCFLVPTKLSVHRAFSLQEVNHIYRCKMQEEKIRLAINMNSISWFVHINCIFENFNYYNVNDVTCAWIKHISSPYEPMTYKCFEYFDFPILK